MQNCTSCFVLFLFSMFTSQYIDTIGDKICIFGFSRGAYTTRALAGMLQKVRDPWVRLDPQLMSRLQVGLLPLSNHAQLPFAYNMYAHVAVKSPPPGASPDKLKKAEDEVDLVETFKRTFCREVRVEFLGVWSVIMFFAFFYQKLMYYAGTQSPLLDSSPGISLLSSQIMASGFSGMLFHSTNAASSSCRVSSRVDMRIRPRRVRSKGAFQKLCITPAPVPVICQVWPTVMKIEMLAKRRQERTTGRPRARNGLRLSISVKASRRCTKMHSMRVKSRAMSARCGFQASTPVRLLHSYARLFSDLFSFYRCRRRISAQPNPTRTRAYPTPLDDPRDVPLQRRDRL